MRASEFIFEATNPTDPPPKAGTPEFTKSKEYFIKVIQQAIKDFNDDLIFLQSNNTPEYDAKIIDQDKLRDELSNSVVEALISKGSGNFVAKDKTNFKSKFILNNAAAPFNETTAEFNLATSSGNVAVAGLADQATRSWYANRYARFTNPSLWARYSGAAAGKVTRRVAPIEASVARDLETIIGTTVTDSSFWQKLSKKIGVEESKNKLVIVLKNVYKKKNYNPSVPQKVTPLDADAANLLGRELGLPATAVDDIDFWYEFTNKLENRPEVIKRILDNYY